MPEHQLSVETYISVPRAMGVRELILKTGETGIFRCIDTVDGGNPIETLADSGGYPGAGKPLWAHRDGR